MKILSFLDFHLLSQFSIRPSHFQQTLCFSFSGATSAVVTCHTSVMLRKGLWTSNYLAHRLPASPSVSSPTSWALLGFSGGSQPNSPVQPLQT